MKALSEQRIQSNAVGKDEDVEKASFEWWEFGNQRHMPEDLARKAGHDQFRATYGWFSRWKKRHGLVFTALKRDVTAANKFRQSRLPEIFQQYDIYFRALPNSTYIAEKEKKGKRGFKTAKDRVTLMVCCNMDGEKEELLLIGKSKKPRCFKNIGQLPLNYDFSFNAWMTIDIWERWVRKMDRKFHCEKRKIFLLVDNCLAHTEVTGLKSITIEFLPPNTTSVLQPCDMGVIRTLKAHFRHQLRQNIIDTIDDSEEELVANEVVKKVSLLDTMNMLDVAWTKVTAETVRNCWKKGGFVEDLELLPELQPELEPLPLPPPGLTAEMFQQWVTIDDESETTQETTEDEMTDQLVSQIVQTTETATNDDDNEESNDEEAPVPTVTDMRAALATLDRGLQLSGFVHPEFRRLSDAIKEHLRKTFPPKQTTLDKFF